jgi:hypothetical protein
MFPGYPERKGAPRADDSDNASPRMEQLNDKAAPEVWDKFFRFFRVNQLTRCANCGISNGVRIGFATYWHIADLSGDFAVHDNDSPPQATPFSPPQATPHGPSLATPHCPSLATPHGLTVGSTRRALGKKPERPDHPGLESSLHSMRPAPALDPTVKPWGIAC